MTSATRAGLFRRCTLSLASAATLALVLGAATPARAATEQELRQGQRIYREGILPSGEKLKVSMKGEAALPGLTFTCASCHLRSGLGAFDEGIYVPAVNADKLFKPLTRLYKGIKLEHEPAAGPLRPAYTEASLIEALRHGKDPGGRTLSDTMPRYQLDDKDMRLLVGYLKTLSTEVSPGVTDSNIRFATVVSEDAPKAARESLVSALNFFFNLKNGQLRNFNNPRSGAKSRLMAENMVSSRELVDKSLTLVRWTLKGAPETWAAQLEQYNRQEPVFAILGGLVQGSWQPVHQFCEKNEIPCIFPSTDLPVISDSDWYTLYLSKGYYQEGESTARFIAGNEALLKKGRVVQLVRSTPQGQALAAGFGHAWQELGHPAPLSLPLDKALDPAQLTAVLGKEKPAVLVVWDEAAALPALEALAGRPDRPQLFLSGRYLGEGLWTLKEPMRDFTFLSYPYSFSTQPKPVMGRSVIEDDKKPSMFRVEVPLKTESQRMNAQTNVLTQFVGQLLMDLNGNYYRDNLLDVAGMMADQAHPLYGRLSFGTGQRYASKGCFIVQLAPGEPAKLVKKSGWTSH